MPFFLNIDLQSICEDITVGIHCFDSDSSFEWWAGIYNTSEHAWEIPRNLSARLDLHKYLKNQCFQLLNVSSLVTSGTALSV